MQEKREHTLLHALGLDRMYASKDIKEHAYLTVLHMATEIYTGLVTGTRQNVIMLLLLSVALGFLLHLLKQIT